MTNQITHWQIATLLSKKLVAENVISMRFAVSKFIPHLPLQHYDIRLVSSNGYIAERSYSVVSSPNESGVVEFGIELLENGEVSPYLWQMKEGAQIEIRGPIGGYFVYDKTMSGDIALLAGGSGVTPFMSLLQYLDESGFRNEVRLLLSSSTISRIPYFIELRKLEAKRKNFKLLITITDEKVISTDFLKGRIEDKMLKKVCLDDTIIEGKKVYVWGPTSFVEEGAKIMTRLGFKPSSVRTERFGW